MERPEIYLTGRFWVSTFLLRVVAQCSSGGCNPRPRQIEARSISIRVIPAR